MTPKDDADETISASTDTENTSDEQETQEQEGADQDAPQQPKPVTMDDLAQFGEGLIKRMKQSTNDQIKSQLASYNKMVKLHEQTGAPISAEAQKAARQAIRDSVLDGEDEAEAETPTEQTGVMSDEQWSEYVAVQTMAAFQAVGAEVKPGDPEWKKVEKSFTESDTLAKHLYIATKAAEKKKERLASGENTADARTIKTGKPTTALSAEITGHDLFQRAHSEK
jgi:hypothetical protein